jgi:putative chitobiose transport system permease protein
MKWLGLLLRYAALCVIAVVFIIPFVLLVSSALKPATQQVYSFPPDLIPRPPVGTWFAEAWSKIPFLRYLGNSFFFEITMVPLNLLISALTAYPLARMRFVGRQFFFYAIISTMFLPGEVMLIPRFLIIARFHMVDSYLGVILPGLIGAFGVFLLRQAFLQIPRELEDAARIDGCGEFRLWWQIMIPQIAPSLATLAVFDFVSVWNSFLWPLVILKDSNKFPISLGVAYLAGIFGSDVRSLAAGTVMALVPVLIFFLLMQRYFVSGLKGAVKG